MEKKKRIEYLDIFRSLGIIAMVMGHVGFGSEFDHFIHAFHMPMFFWISGFLFKHKSKSELTFWDLVVKKAKALLLPYVVFGIAHYILYICINHNEIDISPLLHLVSFNTNGLPICGALWFLTALFFADILFFVIDRYIASEPLKAIVIVLIALVGNMYKLVFLYTLPFALCPAFVGVGLYYIGYLCRKFDKNQVANFLFNLPWIINIPLGIVTAVLVFFNGYINMRAETYAIIPLFWINAILCVIVGVNLSKLIYKFVKNSIVEKWLVGIGQDSIVYVCLNQVVIMFVKKAIQMLKLPIYLSLFLTLGVVMAVLWAVSKMIVKTKLKLIIGK